MAQGLKAFTALAEEPGSVPNTQEEAVTLPAEKSMAAQEESCKSETPAVGV